MRFSPALSATLADVGASLVIGSIVLGAVRAVPRLAGPATIAAAGVGLVLLSRRYAFLPMPWALPDRQPQVIDVTPQLETVTA